MRTFALLIIALIIAAPAAAQQYTNPNARLLAELFAEPGMTTTPGEVIADRVDDVLDTESEDLEPRSLIGGWDLDFLGGTCSLFLTLTRWPEADGQYRASTRDCEVETLRNIGGWALERNILILTNTGGAALAVLTTSVGETRFTGRLIADDLPIAVSRGVGEVLGYGVCEDTFAGLAMVAGPVVIDLTQRLTDEIRVLLIEDVVIPLYTREHPSLLDFSEVLAIHIPMNTAWFAVIEELDGNGHPALWGLAAFADGDRECETHLVGMRVTMERFNFPSSFAHAIAEWERAAARP